MDDIIKETLKQALKEAIREEREERIENKDEAMNTPVKDLDFSVRTRNVFSNNNIETVRDIISTGKKGLKAFKNFGAGSFDEVKYRLQELNIEIK